MPPIESKKNNKVSTYMQNAESSQKTVQRAPKKPSVDRSTRKMERSREPERSRAQKSTMDKSQAQRSYRKSAPDKSHSVRKRAPGNIPPGMAMPPMPPKRQQEEKTGIFGFGRSVKNNGFDSLKSMVSKVRSRSSSLTRKTLNYGEDAFVTTKSRRGTNGTPPPPCPIICEEVDADGTDIISTHSELAVVKSNTDNNGQIFIGKRPFWFVPSDSPSDEEMKGIFESPEINAQSLIEVSDGKKTLKSSPAVPTSLDSFEDLESMKTRDSLYFSNDHIFSNTVRSIINTNNLMNNFEPSGSKSCSGKKLVLSEPTVTLFYKRRTRMKTREDKFVHMIAPTKKKK